MKRKTPRDIKVPLSLIDFSDVPEWSLAQLNEAFIKVRDERFLFMDCDNTPRRIPWMFAENGCYLRAALVRKKFKEWNLPKIKKLFIFGEMKFSTHVKLNDTVSFRDHVACVVRVKDETYVIDPPVSFDKPLLLRDWTNLLFSKSDTKFCKLSLASEFTLSHNCPVNTKNEHEEVGMKDGVIRDINFFTENFLQKEKAYLLSKNINIKEALGDSPIWI